MSTQFNIPAKAKSLLHSLKQATIGIGSSLNSDKTAFMPFKQNKAITKPLTLVDQLTCLISNISSTERDVNVCIEKAWTTIDVFLIIWKSDVYYKIKREFFQAVARSVQLYSCTTWIYQNAWRKRYKGTTQKCCMPLRINLAISCP